MYTIDDAISGALILIPVGILMRVVFCAVMMTIGGDEQAMYKKRLINGLVFLIIAVSALGIRSLVAYYY